MQPCVRDDATGTWPCTSSPPPPPLPRPPEASRLPVRATDRVAARLLLGSVDDTSPDALNAIAMPTLVVCGAEDQDNGSAPALAEALPDGRYVEVPGTHMSSVTRRELGEAIVRFLSG